MTKKSIIIISASVAAVLFTAAAVISYILFKSDEKAKGDLRRESIKSNFAEYINDFNQSSDFIRHQNIPGGSCIILDSNDARVSKDYLQSEITDGNVLKALDKFSTDTDITVIFVGSDSNIYYKQTYQSGLNEFRQANIVSCTAQSAAAFIEVNPSAVKLSDNWYYTEMAAQ